jgi:hypothetical protein
MLLNKKKLQLLISTIVIINGFCFLFTALSTETITSPDIPISCDQSAGSAAYLLQLPFHAGSMLSDRVEHIMVCQARPSRKLLTRFSFLCSDDSAIIQIIRFNNEVFQGIQLRTTSEFICELQV